MKKHRLAAGIVATIMLAGTAGFAVVNSEKTTDISMSNVNELAEEEEIKYSASYGLVQSLYYKINELWRLSINSDLSSETTAAISTLNDGFDTKLLEKAINAKGEEVIDEYIYSVIAGLDFDLYLDDEAAYEELRDNAEYIGEVLTQTSIDEYLNQLNREIVQTQINTSINVPSVDLPMPIAEEKAPTMPKLQTVESAVPQNPVDAVRRETNAITENALGIEVE